MRLSENSSGQQCDSSHACARQSFDSADFLKEQDARLASRACGVLNKFAIRRASFFAFRNPCVIGGLSDANRVTGRANRDAF